MGGAVMAADLGGGVNLVGLWTQFQAAWEAGGLAFILFIGLLLFFTGRVATGRERAADNQQWKERYEENDKRWRDRWQEQKDRADNMERMLYQQMGYQNRVATVAERVADKVVAVSAVLTGPLPGSSVEGG